MNREPQPAQTRFPLIALRPLPWVPMLLYLGVLGAGLYFNTASLCTEPVSPGKNLTFVGTLLFLFVLEQSVQRHYAAQPSKPLAIGLLVVRMLAFEVIAGVDCSGFSRVLFPIVPFVAY